MKYYRHKIEINQKPGYFPEIILVSVLTLLLNQSVVLSPVMKTESSVLDKAREIELYLNKKYGADVFLTGSLVTGLSIPGSIDYDFVISAETPRQFFELREKLSRDLRPMPLNRETSDFAVFQGSALGGKIDVGLLPVHKAQTILSKQEHVRSKLTPRQRRRIVRQKKILRNFPIFSRRIYNWYKRRLWKKLGMPRYPRVDMNWPDDGKSWPD